jgi:hypothetical protein
MRERELCMCLFECVLEGTERESVCEKEERKRET